MIHLFLWLITVTFHREVNAQQLERWAIFMWYICTPGVFQVPSLWDTYCKSIVLLFNLLPTRLSFLKTLSLQPRRIESIHRSLGVKILNLTQSVGSVDGVYIFHLLPHGRDRDRWKRSTVKHLGRTHFIIHRTYKDVIQSSFFDSAPTGDRFPLA